MRQVKTSPSAAPLSAEAPTLDKRNREILKDIIVTHIESGAPVSSRAVSKHAQHALSAASIRNVMADLEEAGYLQQPHTSAGRVPTAAAYRFFVEQVMHEGRLPGRDRRYIEETLLSAGDDGDPVAAVPRLLAELSHHVGVVLRPSMEETALRSIEFVPLTGRRVLCVVVAVNGYVDQTVIETENDIPRRELVRISNYMNDHFAGQRLGEIRDRLLRMMSEERAHMDQWLGQAIDLAHRAVDSQAPEVLVEGTSALLELPEIKSIHHVRRMLDTFADKALLVKILNRCLQSDGVRFLIGDDSEVTSELDFSLVVAPYGDGKRSLGTLGIIGPARMEYPRIVPLVLFLGETLSKALEIRQ